MRLVLDVDMYYRRLAHHERRDIDAWVDSLPGGFLDRGVREVAVTGEGEVTFRCIDEAASRGKGDVVTYTETVAVPIPPPYLDRFEPQP